VGKDDDRRAEILASAADLFAAKGVASTTVREIGDAAGILSGSLYHHFTSKDAMVEEIVREYLRDLRARYEVAVASHSDPLEQLRALIRASFESLRDQPAACEIYQNDYRYLRAVPGLSDLDKIVAGFQATWIDVIQAGIDTGVFRAELDPTIVYRFLRDAIWPTVRWYRTGRKYRIDDIAEKCIGLFTYGIAAPAATRA